MVVVVGWGERGAMYLQKFVAGCTLLAVDLPTVRVVEVGDFFLLSSALHDT